MGGTGWRPLIAVPLYEPVFYLFCFGARCCRGDLHLRPHPPAGGFLAEIAWSNVMTQSGRLERLLTNAGGGLSRAPGHSFSVVFTVHGPHYSSWSSACAQWFGC